MRARTVFVDIAKLRDYCLSEGHPRGRHKARVFRSRLGLTADDAGFLRDLLVRAARSRPRELIAAEQDAYGGRFILDISVTTSAGTAIVRSGWIIRTGERALRFVTCYVLP
ncbi:MAG TPA: hypothetical protein VMF86_10085 [Stellaceae bacterium]|nr:hypothetical protein [Stellaceae bacterium]